MNRKVFFIIINLFLFSLYCSVFPVKPPAMENLGNTCYMNSSLQCLYQVEDLTNFVLSKDVFGYYDQGTPSYEYVRLVNEVTHKSKSEFIKASEFCIPIFQNFFYGEKYRQEDAAEFIQKLIDHLSDLDIQDQIKNKLKQERKFFTGTRILQTKVNEIFGVIINEELEYLSESLKSTKLIYFNNLSLPINKILDNKLINLDNLKSCLNEFFAPEVMTGENQVEFNGKKTDAKRTYKSFVSTPSYLILSLKRFSYNKNTKTFDKLSQAIKFDLNLDLASYFEKKLDNSLDMEYELFGFVQHSGSFGGGHYTAYVKNKGQWWYCNDSSISIKNIKELEKIVASGLDGSFTPYILFYKKKSHAQLIKPEIKIGQNLNKMLSNLNFELTYLNKENEIKIVFS